MKYNIGDLLVMSGNLITYRGVIISMHQDSDWLGGGYYKVYWVPKEDIATGDISFGHLKSMINKGEVAIYPALQ